MTKSELMRMVDWVAVNDKDNEYQSICECDNCAEVEDGEENEEVYHMWYSVTEDDWNWYGSEDIKEAIEMLCGDLADGNNVHICVVEDGYDSCVMGEIKYDDIAKR